MPALRIVPEELWLRAHARIAQTREAYRLDQRPGGRPEAGLESAHLLSGFVVCGRCQGAMHAITRTSGGRRTPRWTRTYYLCNGWRVNGTCDNRAALPRDRLDEAVLAALEDDVLTPDLVDDVIRRALALWGERHADLEAEQRRVAAELRRVERELQRCTDAIAAGGATLPSLLEALQVRERRRGELLAQLEHLDGLSRTVRPTLPIELRATLRERLLAWGTLLRSHPQEARPILRQLLVGRLVVHPHQAPDGWWWEFEAAATYGGLLAGVVGLVPPG